MTGGTSVPVMERTRRPLRADEVTSLRAFLDYHRDTLLSKCAGLTVEQLAQRHPPSQITLGGLVRHLTAVESGWFEEGILGLPLMPPFDQVDWDADKDWDWHDAEGMEPDELFAGFAEARARADAVLDDVLARPTGLDTLSVEEADDGLGGYTVRWTLLHMIEEYARHNGHADVLREQIDGRTGA